MKGWEPPPKKEPLLREEEAIPRRLDAGGEERNAPWESTKLLARISVLYSLCGAYPPYRGREEGIG